MMSPVAHFGLIVFVLLGISGGILAGVLGHPIAAASIMIVTVVILAAVLLIKE
jgi:hypothetical protein